MTYKTTRYQDPYNTAKVWVVRYFSNRHYSFNQEINGHQFYPKFITTTKKHLINVGVLSFTSKGQYYV